MKGKRTALGVVVIAVLGGIVLLVTMISVFWQPLVYWILPQKIPIDKNLTSIQEIYPLVVSEMKKREPFVDLVPYRLGVMLHGEIEKRGLMEWHFRENKKESNLRYVCEVDTEKSMIIRMAGGREWNKERFGPNDYFNIGDWAVDIEQVAQILKEKYGIDDYFAVNLSNQYIPFGKEKAFPLKNDSEFFVQVSGGNVSGITCFFFIDAITGSARELTSEEEASMDKW